MSEDCKEEKIVATKRHYTTHIILSMFPTNFTERNTC